MKKRKTHKKELNDCRKCIWNTYFFYSPPIKAFMQICFDKHVRLNNFEYPY